MPTKYKKPQRRRPPNRKWSWRAQTNQNGVQREERAARKRARLRKEEYF